MANPTYTLECAFSTANPLTASPTWTDISAYMIDFTTQRGRPHELQRTQAGTMDVRLINKDRRFDPSFTTGTYYPNVLPMKQIRLRATFSGTTYDLFRGFVLDWGQHWGDVAQASQGEATCVVHAVDAFNILSLAQADSYRSAVLADGPALYFPMDEQPGSIEGANLGNGGDGSSTDVLTYFPNPSERLVSVGGRTDGPFFAGADQLAPDFVNPTNIGSPVYYPATEVTASTGPLTIEFWIHPDTLTGTPNYIVAQAIGEYWRVILNGTGQVSFEYVASRLGGAGWVSVGSTANLAPTGATHHIAVVRDINTVTFYQDGVFSQIYTALADPYPIPPAAQGGLAAIGFSFDGLLAHLAIYPTALTADRIAAHYAAACERLVDATSDAAVTGLLDCVGWPAGLTTLDTGASIVSITPEGPVLDALLKVAEDTEHGLLFLSGAGSVTTVARDTLMKRTAAATFGDSGGDTPYTNLVLAFDDKNIYTEVQASGAEETHGPVIASDATAITNYGRRVLNDTTVVASDLELFDQANGLLGTYKAPTLRPSSMQLQGIGSLVQQLTRELGDMLTIHRNPPGGGAQISLNALVEGISHHTGPELNGRLVSTFSLVPTFSLPWVLGDSTNGKLDVTTDLGW